MCEKKKRRSTRPGFECNSNDESSTRNEKGAGRHSAGLCVSALVFRRHVAVRGGNCYCVQRRADHPRADGKPRGQAVVAVAEYVTLPWESKSRLPNVWRRRRQSESTGQKNVTRRLQWSAPHKSVTRTPRNTQSVTTTNLDGGGGYETKTTTTRRRRRMAEEARDCWSGTHSTSTGPR